MFHKVYIIAKIRCQTVPPIEIHRTYPKPPNQQCLDMRLSKKNTKLVHVYCPNHFCKQAKETQPLSARLDSLDFQ